MKDTIYIMTQIRKAKKTDLLIASGLLRMGAPYYILNPKTNDLSGVYVLDAYTNSQKLQEFFKAGFIYVPTIPFNEEIINNLQQNDMKVFQNLEKVVTN